MSAETKDIGVKVGLACRELIDKVANLKGANAPVTCGYKVAKTLQEGGTDLLGDYVLKGEGPFSENKDHAMYELFIGVNYLIGLYGTAKDGEFSQFRFRLGEEAIKIKQEERRKTTYGGN